MIFSGLLLTEALTKYILNSELSIFLIAILINNELGVRIV